MGWVKALRMKRLGLASFACALACVLACNSRKAATQTDAGDVAAPEPSTLKIHAAPKAGVPQLGAIAFEVPVYQKADKSSPKIGLLRLGTIVGRKPEPAGKSGCPGGFYEIEPRGFVCISDDSATLDLTHPLVRAAHVRPDRRKPLPYSYAFVRAVAPLYLRPPSAEEQKKSEFKLEEHLEWYGRHHEEINAISPGANDLELPFFPKAKKQSSELLLGQRYGSEEDFDPMPFWLEGGKRSIPNISSFKVPSYAVFADRTRRHTGLSLIGAFKTPELNREYAITTDLRLVPISKIKPDTGSQWHGVEIDGNETKIPFAFVRQPCDAKTEDTCPYSLTLDGENAPRRVKKLAYRSVVKLTGQAKNIGNVRYRELEGGLWAKAHDLGAVFEPNEWPAAAGKDQKWVEVSILQQTLTLWQGKKPLYATLVSTGQDGMADPKQSKATVRGEFRIKNKFITATMDSNERTTPETKNVEEGKTLRRGSNNFELRDVPYVQYFEGAYALHVAYWHDVFGQPRSHGCINLAPADGLRVFQFTEPNVPDDWHGMEVGDPNAGTWIVVHR